MLTTNQGSIALELYEANAPKVYLDSLIFTRTLLTCDADMQEFCDSGSKGLLQRMRFPQNHTKFHVTNR